jgi:hypothetical protein
MPFTTLPTPVEPPKGAYSILEFCAAHSISESMFYKLKRVGQTPDEMVVGTRRLISVEAAARWRAEREAAAAETSTVPEAAVPESTPEIV